MGVLGGLLRLVRTPRQLLSALRETRSLWQNGLEGEINWYHLLWLCALKTAEPRLYWWIYSEKSLFEAGRIPFQDKELPDQTRKRLEKTLHATDPEDRKAVIYGVCRLFPKFAELLGPSYRLPHERDRAKQEFSEQAGTPHERSESYADRAFSRGVGHCLNADKPTLVFILSIRDHGFNAEAFTDRYLSSFEALTGPLKKIVQFAPLIPTKLAWRICRTIFEWVSDPANAHLWPEPPAMLPKVLPHVRGILHAAGRVAQPPEDLAERMNRPLRSANRFLRAAVGVSLAQAPLVAAELILAFGGERPKASEWTPYWELLAEGLSRRFVHGGGRVVPSRWDPTWYLRRLMWFLTRLPNRDRLRTLLTERLLAEAQGPDGSATREAIVWALVRGTYQLGAPDNHTRTADQQEHALMFDMDKLLPAIRQWKRSDFPGDAAGAWHALRGVLALYSGTNP